MVAKEALVAPLSWSDKFVVYQADAPVEANWSSLAPLGAKYVCIREVLGEPRERSAPGAPSAAIVPSAKDVARLLAPTTNTPGQVTAPSAPVTPTPRVTKDTRVEVY